MAKFAAKLLKWTIRLVVTGLLLIGWGLAALALHVVIVPADEPDVAEETVDRASEPTEASTGEVVEEKRNWQVLIVPKNRMGLTDTYVDTRDWTTADAEAHPELVSRLVEADKIEHLHHVLGQTVSRKLEEMLGRRVDTLKAISED